MTDLVQKKVFEELDTLLKPLIETQGDPEKILGFLNSCGWRIDAFVAQAHDSDFVKSVVQLISHAEVITELINNPPESMNEFIVQSIEKIAPVFKNLTDLIGALPNVNMPADIDELPGDILNALIIHYVQTKSLSIFKFLELLSIINKLVEEEKSINNNVYRIKNQLPIIQFDRLAKFIDDPEKTVTEKYWPQGFDDNGVGAMKVSGQLIDIAHSLGLYRFGLPEVDLSDPAIIIEDNTLQLSKEILLDDYSSVVIGLKLEDTGNQSYNIKPFGKLKTQQRLGNFLLTISGNFQNSGIKIGLQGIEIIDSSNSTFEIKAELKNEFSEPAIWGSPNGINLGLAGFSLIQYTLLKNNDLIIEAGFRLHSAKLNLTADEGDGFLQLILPSTGIKSEFDLGIIWSNKDGISFQGSGGLEIRLPMHIELGPIEVQGILVAVKIENGDFPIDLATTLKANLGPLTAVVEDFGLKAILSFPSEGRNLGPVDLALGFKPPNGVGLSIDAGVVKGGGYLYFDFDKEEYAGALELSIAEFLTLKAIGLITTRMPDGSKGFSMLIIITAEFGSPIQLSFGFTLSGVGGLLGLHRTMRLQPLVEGVRTGAVNSVMFPTNVVENAPKIISDLRTFFPPFKDIFLIGPMAKIGWGTPNLVTLSLGVIIEIPGNIAILGVLKVALPDEDAPLLILQVNFMGAIEFDKKRAWFFASMYESRVLFMTIEGEMGVLVAWGDDANFVVSVGGFHPAFNPPPLPFPEPKRIAISILNTSLAKIRVEGYFAVTSNTVQFGARAELYFGVSAFNIDGHLAFDALFQFSPFYFIIQISASLSVKVFGIGLFSVSFRGALEGPTPWRIEGTGSISILFFSIDVDFSHSWGEEADTTLPPIQVMPLLKAEYEKLENWRAQVPAANSILVSLRKIQTTEDLVLHPVGTLKISQRAVPLDLTIDKVGAKKPSDANYFTLAIDTADLDLEEKDEAKEMFAMAQYKDMSDSKKLSSPAYEKKNGGLEVSVKGEQLKTTSAVKRVVRYEQIIIDSNFKRFVKPFFKFLAVLFTLFLKGSAVTKSTLSNKYKKQKMPFAEKIAVLPNLYAVASNTDNAPFNEEAKAFTSYTQAEEFMNRKVKENPNLQDSLHVIPQVEMKRAA
jgi:hypothetical protein